MTEELRISTQQHPGDVVSIALAGPATIRTCGDLEKCIETLLREFRFRIVINMGAVTDIDTRPLEIISKLRKQLIREHGGLALIVTTPRVQGALVRSGLIRNIESFCSLGDALAEVQTNSF